jgi:anti-sigma factor RsiW
MNCDDSRIYLPAYLDDELYVAESLRVQKHRAECRHCRQAENERLALRSALRDPDLRAYPSANFAERIEVIVRQAAKEEGRPRRSSRCHFLRLESLGWLPVAAVLLVVTAIGTLLVANSLRSLHHQLIASAELAGHIRSLQPNHLMCLRRTATL